VGAGAARDPSQNVRFLTEKGAASADDSRHDGGGAPLMESREKVLALLKRHGWNATSFQILEDGFRYWFDGDDACVAYVDTGHAWVAAGSPVAAPERLASVAEAFVRAGREASRRVSFFATEARFEPGPGIRSFLIGEQPVWDPAGWPDIVSKSRNLRDQLKRARAKGVTVRAASPEEVAAGPLRAAVGQLMARWLAARPLAPMGFLVDVQPFLFAEERRYFVAERGFTLVGFLAAVPVYTRNGWLLEDLLRDSAAPNGTTELLVDAAMTALALEGSPYVTLGLAPLAGPVSGFLGLARDRLAALYDFRGVHAFRAKLQPRAWDPIYLAYADSSRPAALASSVAILDALTAFARGRLASFGVETLLRGPAVVVRALAILLVPWTVMLACLDRQHFPFPAAQWAWVTFDVLLVLALLSLASRWRRWLGVALAAAVATDAAVTWAEVLLYNVPRARGWLEWIGLALGCVAPTIAAVVLGRAVGHHRRLS
jgi:phosphatidylglycerol lysyltransferase